MDAGQSGCRAGFIGDPAGTPELRITALGPEGGARVLDDNDPVPMMFPEQGGRVIFAGVDVNNVNACGASLKGVLRDLASQQVRLDERTTNLRRYDGGRGGSNETDVSTFSNIPVCPNQWSQTALYEGTYRLELTLTDRDQRVVEKSVLVRPYCAEPANEAECRCLCRKDYVLGQSCDVDGGAG